VAGRRGCRAAAAAGLIRIIHTSREKEAETQALLEVGVRVRKGGTKQGEPPDRCCRHTNSEDRVGKRGG